MKSAFTIFAILSLAWGCASKPIRRTPPIPSARITVERAESITAAATQPTKLVGCAWDYGEIPPGLTFEVWASTNLVDWAIATNTSAKVALFPQKQMEFYKVRARDEHGLVSDWATVPK